MTLEPNPFAWPALLSALNPELNEASPNDRFSFTVFVPEGANVKQMREIMLWFVHHDGAHEEVDGVTIEGAARRSDLPSLFTALSAVHGSLLDTR